MKQEFHKISDLRKNIDKIVVNTGIGRLSQTASFNDKVLPEVLSEISAITGQKAITRPAKQSIAGFKMREGNIVGAKVTLRRARMEKFLQKVIQVVLPRIRDFRGIDSKAVDQGGNLTVGIKENIVFPEISAETSKVNFGIEFTVVPKVKNRKKAMELYKQVGIPFKKNSY